MISSLDDRKGTGNRHRRNVEPDGNGIERYGREYEVRYLIRQLRKYYNSLVDRYKEKKVKYDELTAFIADKQ